MNIKKTIKDAITPKEYVSESPDKGRLGSTYRKIGPISVLKHNSTPESRKKAIESRNAKEKKQKDEKNKKKLKQYKAGSATNANQAIKQTGLL